MRRHTFLVSPDGFHRSQFAFLTSVSANCVFPPFFSPFLLQLVQPKMKWHHAEGKSGWMRTHKALQENQGLMAGRVSAQQEDEVVIKEENLTSEKVIGGTDEAFSEDGSARTEIWKISALFWTDDEERQMGWKGKESRRNKYIWMEKGGGGDKTLRHRLEGRSGALFPFTALLCKRAAL